MTRSRTILPMRERREDPPWRESLAVGKGGTAKSNSVSTRSRAGYYRALLAAAAVKTRRRVNRCSFSRGVCYLSNAPDTPASVVYRPTHFRVPILIAYITNFYELHAVRTKRLYLRHVGRDRELPRNGRELIRIFQTGRAQSRGLSLFLFSRSGES